MRDIVVPLLSGGSGNGRGARLIRDAMHQGLPPLRPALRAPRANLKCLTRDRSTEQLFLAQHFPPELQNAGRVSKAHWERIAGVVPRTLRQGWRKMPVPKVQMRQGRSGRPRRPHGSVAVEIGARKSNCCSDALPLHSGSRRRTADTSCVVFGERQRQSGSRRSQRSHSVALPHTVHRANVKSFR